MSAKHQGGGSDPATRAEAVTPSDANELTTVSRAVYVGGTGDLAVVMADGQSVTFAAVPAGTLLPIRIRKVKSTGTTATSVVTVS